MIVQGKMAILAAMLVSALSGCALFDRATADDAELAAAAVREYMTVRQAELAEGGEAALLEDTPSAAASVLGSDPRMNGRAPGMASTAEELGDGKIRVVVTWVDGDGLCVVSTVERDKRPSAYSTDIVSTEGRATKTVEGILVSDMNLSIQWKWNPDLSAYRRYTVTREGEDLGFGGQLRASTRVEWAPDGSLVERKVAYFRFGETLALRTVTYTPVLDDSGNPLLGQNGDQVLKAVSDDRDGWALILSRRAPRVVEYFRQDGSLALRVSHQRVEGVPGTSVLREYYDASGTLLVSESGSMRMTANDDGSLTLTRKIGNRSVAVRVMETDSGFVIDRNGKIWTIVANNDGSLAVLGPDGRSWLVVYGQDGVPEVSGI